MQQQLRVFHWQTRSYAEHKAFGKAYKALDDTIDTFVEIFMGKYGRPVAKVTFSVDLDNIKDVNVLEVIDSYVEFLTSNLTSELDPEKDTDLFNIRDEMLGDLNQLKYLLTLK